MGYLLLGVLGYLLLIIADLNKVKQIHPFLNAAFGAGVIIIGLATAGILLDYPASFTLPGTLPTIFVALAVPCILIQLYILFFAVPFKQTYVELGNYQIIDTGFFGLARHPGVMWFFLFYTFLWLGTGKMMVLWANVVWTACDIIHVYLQDRVFFPRMFKDYDVYIRKVPFMIPTRKSLKNFFKK